MEPTVIDEPSQDEPGQPSNGTAPAELNGPAPPHASGAPPTGPAFANGPPPAQMSGPGYPFQSPPVNFSGNVPPAFNTSFQEPQTTPEGDLDGLRRLRDDIVAGAHPTFRPTAAQFLDHAPVPLPPVVTSASISAPPPILAMMSAEREEEDRARQLEWEEEERERQEVEEELMLAQVLEQRKADRIARQSQRAAGTSTTRSNTTPLPSISLPTLSVPTLSIAPIGLAALPAVPVVAKETRGQRKDREAAEVQRLRAKRIEEDEREAADREEGEIHRSRAKRTTDDPSDSGPRQSKRPRGSRGGKNRRHNYDDDDDRERSPRGRERSPRPRSPRARSPRRRSRSPPSPRRPLTDLGSLAADKTDPIAPPSATAKADPNAPPQNPVVVSKVASPPLLRVGTLVEVVEQKKREPTPPPPTPARETTPHVRLTQSFTPLKPHPSDNNRWAPPAPTPVRPAGLPATPSASTAAPGARSAPSSPIITSSTNMYVAPPITTPKDEPRWAAPKVEERKKELPPQKDVAPVDSRRYEEPRRIPDDRPRPRAPSPSNSNYGDRRRPLDDRPFDSGRLEFEDRRGPPIMQRFDDGRQGDLRRSGGGERDERDRFAGPPLGRDLDDRYDGPPRGFEQDRRDGYDPRPLPFDERDRRDPRYGPGPTYRREVSPPRQQQSFNSGPPPFESRNGDRWEAPRDDARYSGSRLPPSNESPRPPPSLQSRLNLPSSGPLPVAVNGREIIPGGRGLVRPTSYPIDSRSGPPTSSGPPLDDRRFGSESRDSRLPTSASSYQDRFDGPRRSPPPFDRRSPPPFDGPRGGPAPFSNSQNSNNSRGPPPFDGRRSPPPSFDRRSPPPFNGGSRGGPPPFGNTARGFDGPAPYSSQPSFDNGRRSPPPQFNNNRPRSPPPQFNNNRPRSPPPQAFRGPPPFDQRSQFEGQGQRQGDGGQRRFDGGRDESRRADMGGRDPRDGPMGRDVGRDGPMGRDDRRDDRPMMRDGPNRDGPPSRGPPSQDLRFRDSFNGPPPGWNDNYGPPRPSSPPQQRQPPLFDDRGGPSTGWKQGQYRQV